MSDLDLDAIEARVNAATEGPWEYHEWDPHEAFGRQIPAIGAVLGPNTRSVADFDLQRRGERENAEFIAAARRDVPDLLAALRATRTQRDDAVELLREVTEELSQWGMGDIHYGDQPQERRVAEPVARARAFLASLAPEEANGDT